MQRNQPHLAPSKEVEKEIVNLLQQQLPLKPKVPAFRSTPVATSVNRNNNNNNEFKSASEMLSERGYPPPHTRNELEITEHPLEYIIQKNKDNMEEVKLKFHPRIPPPKRSLDDFLKENPDVSDISQNTERYWRNKYARKCAKLANIRNRLRAVGLTNLQLSDELSVALTTVAALKGANGALHYHNTTLQEQLQQRLLNKEYAFRTAIGMDLEVDDDEELTPTLEELYCDEILVKQEPEEEQVTPSQLHEVEVPAAPHRENNNNHAHPCTSGAIVPFKLYFTPIHRKPSIFD